MSEIDGLILAIGLLMVVWPISYRLLIFFGGGELTDPKLLRDRLLKSQSLVDRWAAKVFYFAIDWRWLIMICGFVLLSRVHFK